MPFSIDRTPSRGDTSWLRARLRRHLAELLRLAGPVIVARAGLLTMAIVDTMVVGRFDTVELAHLSLASALIGAIIASGTGMSLGTLVMTANAIGRDAPGECGAVWRRGVIYALLVGVVTTAVCLAGEDILLLLGQTPDLAAGAGRVMAILGLGVPLGMAYAATAFFMEGLRRPWPSMIAMVIANVLNFFADWLLVFGAGPIPAMGADGAAWSSTIIRLFLAAAMIIYVWHMPGHALYGVRRWPGWRWRDWRRQRQIGYGAGTSIGVEAGAFSILGIFAGWLGTLALGAHTIAFNLLAVIFMVALGLGSATAVRVGVAHGRRDLPDMALAGWTGLAVTTLAMAAIGLGLFLAPTAIAGAFTTDPELIRLAAPVIAFTAFILVFDGGQVVMVNALRGRGDSATPALLHVISYLVVMAPLGWLLAIPLGRGVLGLYEGILIASIVSLAMLGVRFQRLARRDREAAAAG